MGNVFSATEMLAALAGGNFTPARLIPLTQVHLHIVF